MVASMTSFTVNDVFMKLISDELPLFQSLFLRGSGVAILLLIICAAKDQLSAPVSASDNRKIWIRSVAEALVTVLFLTALFNMPIANVSAILQSLPLVVTIAGALFFGEMLGWRRIIAIGVGLIGVLLIVKPGGAGFNIYSIFAIAAVLLITVRDLIARQISAQVPSTIVALRTTLIVTGIAGIASLFVTWNMPSLFAVLGTLCASIAIVGASIFSVSAMRVGEIGAIAPFRYTSLLVALILGLLVFNEWPDRLSLIGAALVVATGLFTLWREHRHTG